MKIESTTNYDDFASILSNREVDERHVGKLMSAIQIKNLLHLNPITCNFKMEVIDGQHRLEAAKRLKVPIFYQLDENITKEDIATINSNSKNWSIADYINYHTIEKRFGFDKLSSFLSEYPFLSSSTALMLLASGNNRNIQELKSGRVDVSNYKEACEIAEIIKWYRNLIDWAYERNFVMAVTDCYRTPEYDHDKMKAKLDYQSRSLVRCVSRKQYLEMLEEIYNHKLQNKIKFS